MGIFDHIIPDEQEKTKKPVAAKTSGSAGIFDHIIQDDTTGGEPSHIQELTQVASPPGSLPFKPVDRFEPETEMNIDYGSETARPKPAPSLEEGLKPPTDASWRLDTTRKPATTGDTKETFFDTAQGLADPKKPTPSAYEYGDAGHVPKPKQTYLNPIDTESLQTVLQGEPYSTTGHREESAPTVNKETGEIETHGRVWTDEEIEQAKYYMGSREHEKEFTQEDRLNLRRAENAAHPIATLPAQFKTALSIGLASPFNVGEKLIPGLNEGLSEEAAQYSGGKQIAIEATGQVFSEAIEWYVIAKLFKALGWAGELPVAEKATKTLGRIVGLEKLAKTNSVLERVISTTVGAMTKGSGVGTLTESLRQYNEGATFEEALPKIAQSAAVMGTISTVFHAVGLADNSLWAKKFRKYLIKAINEKWAKVYSLQPAATPKPEVHTASYQGSTAKDAPYVTVDGKRAKMQAENPTTRLRGTKESNQSLQAGKNIDLQKADKIVSEQQARLLGIKDKSMFGSGRSNSKDPLKAVEELMTTGFESGVYIAKGSPRFQKGLGKNKPAIEMPMTRMAELAESAEEFVAAVRNPLHFARMQAARGKQTFPKMPKIPNQTGLGTIPTGPSANVATGTVDALTESIVNTFGTPEAEARKDAEAAVQKHDADQAAKVLSDDLSAIADMATPEASGPPVTDDKDTATQSTINEIAAQPAEADEADVDAMRAEAERLGVTYNGAMEGVDGGITHTFTDSTEGAKTSFNAKTPGEVAGKLKEAQARMAPTEGKTEDDFAKMMEDAKTKDEAKTGQITPKERKRQIILGLLDVDENNNTEIGEVFQRAGYTNIDGFWVEPGAEQQFAQITEDTKKIMAERGVFYVNNVTTDGAAGAAEQINAGKRQIKGVGISFLGEYYTGTDKTVLHEMGHSAWLDLDENTRTMFKQGEPVTEHGKKIKEGKDKRYVALYGEEGTLWGDEDFAQLYAENNGDLEKTIEAKAAKDKDDKAPAAKQTKPDGYFKGNEYKLTGKTQDIDGTTFKEAVLLEGYKKGQTIVVHPRKPVVIKKQVKPVTPQITPEKPAPAKINIDEMSEAELETWLNQEGEKEIAKQQQPAKPEGDIVITPLSGKPSFKTTIKVKADQAQQELKDSLKELGDYMNDISFSNVVADTQLWKLTAKVTAKAVKVGIYKFSDFVNHMVEQIGKERTNKLLPVMRRAWERMKEADTSGKLDSPGKVDLTEAPKSVKIDNKEQVTNESEKEKTGADRPGRVRQDSGKALEGVSPEPGEVSGSEGGVVRSPGGSGEPGSGLHGTGTEEQSGLPGGKGDSTTHIPPAAGRGKAPSSRRKSDLDTHLNYRITDGDNIAAGGVKTKFKKNLTAIKLLKQIESEGRKATSEEQRVLVGYTGWGQMPQVFNRWKDGWEKEFNGLKEVLTDEEYEAARASTPNAHYTSQEIAKGIWDGLQKLGFKGGRVCDPSCGTGMFSGLMPDSIMKNSKLHMVELDPITGRIAAQLYQGADIRIKGYEETVYPDNYFDLHVSNVPFGDYKVYDENMRNVNYFIHDFFFAKALKKTRPGGLIAFITSKGTFDKKSSFIRDQFAKEADLVGAIRLPKTAFKGIANTEVITDIIIFQKRDPKQQNQGEKFSSVIPIRIGKGTSSINEYYTEHPDNVLGRNALTGSMYNKDEYTVEPRAGTDFALEIPALVGKMELPNTIGNKKKTVEELNRPVHTVVAPGNVKQGAYVVDKGMIMQRVGEHLVEVKMRNPKQTTAMIKLRDVARRLIFEQLNPDATDKTLAAARKNLNHIYDTFVKKYGAVSIKGNQRAFSDDPDLPLLLSLERFNADTQIAKKADIFTKRTQVPYVAKDTAEDAIEALAISQNEKGGMDLEFMGGLLGQTEQQIVEELGDILFENPEGTWETGNEYLSGSVRKKLKAARAAVELDPKFQRNVKALEDVQPLDIEPTDIEARLGASWVSEKDYEDFIKHIVGGSYYGATTSVKKFDADGSWIVSGSRTKNNNTTVKWGTGFYDAIKLIDQAMNTKIPTVSSKDQDGKTVINTEETAAARAKQDEIKEEFSRWLWDNEERRERLSREYNDTYNDYITPIWDGSHLTLPGSNITIHLRPHQKDGVWRILMSGNTLLAHEVGAGKTYLMIAAAMEMKRLGRATKPIIVVPNHLLSQWKSDFLELYPSAQVLTAGSKDFAPKNRQVLMNRISTGEWDAIIVPMTSFEKIPMSPDKVREFYHGQIAELVNLIEQLRIESDDSSKSTIKEIEKSKKRLEGQLQKLEAKYKKDSGPYFDELGIDALFVDEAHLFKNLFFHTKMTRVPGIPQNMTQRSFDMFQKCSYLNQITGNKGVVFATGTPISNSVTEMYTMQRYLQLGTLQEKGLGAFDFWANNFGEKVTNIEITPTGSGYRSHTRFAEFINVAELSKMFSSVVDVKMTKDLGLKLPEINGGGPQATQVESSPELADYIKELEKRADAIRDGQVDPRIDNMLKITTDGRKSALDMRLVNPKTADHPYSKINTCVQNVFDIWEKTKKDKSLQVIWCDLSTPKLNTFNLFDDIKNKLIEKGVPEEEVAFVHDAKNDDELQTLYRKAREGDIRVLLATTMKMGTGANVQTRLLAAHHLNPPHRPSDIEQRDGRIVRQGNTNKKVNIYQYVTKGSFDAYMWQTLETKLKFIKQLLSGESSDRRMSDADEMVLSYAELKALSSGNPKIMEVVKLEGETSNLRAQERSHQKQQWHIASELKQIPAYRKDYQNFKQKHEEDGKDYQAAKEAAGENVDITVGDKHYTDKKKAEAALQVVIDKHLKLNAKEANNLIRKGDKFIIGEAYGFELRLDAGVLFNGKRDWYAILHKQGQYRTSQLGDNASGNLTRILNTLGSISKDAEHWQDKLDGLAAKESELKKAANTEFTKKKQLQEKSQLLSTLKHELSLDKKDADQIISDDDVAEASPKKAQKDTYYRYSADGYVAVENAKQYKAEDFPDYEFFIRKDGSDWAMYEAKTGMLVASGRTKLAVIKTFLQRTESMGDEKLDSAIDKGINDHGLSPRYTKEEGDFEADPASDEIADGPGGFVRLPGSSDRPTGTTKKSWLTEDLTKSPDTEIEDFFGRTNKMPARFKLRTIFEKIKLGLRERFVTATPYIQNAPENALTRDMIRTMPEEQRAAREKAVYDLLKVLEGDGSVQVLDAAGLDLLRRKVINQDLLSEARIDRSVSGNFTVEQLEQEDARLDALLAEVPSVRKAYEARQKLWEDVSNDLYDRGVLNEEARDNKHYIRHFVLDFAENITGSLSSKKRKKLSEPYRAYKKQRKGYTGDISTDYLAVEVQALADIYADNAIEDMAKKIAEIHDRKAQFKLEAKNVNFENLVGGEDVVARIVKLRSFIRASRESADSSESDARLQRKGWIEELTNLDPTYPYRQRIAMHMSKFRKIMGLDEGIDYEIDDSGSIFKMLGQEAATDSEAGMSARGVFKAIAERNKLIKSSLGKEFLSTASIAALHGYTEWHYKRPLLFYQATTLPQARIAAMIEGIAEEAGGMINIPVSEIRKALAVGHREGMYIPEEIAMQLDDLPINQRSNMMVESFSKPMWQWWKRWILRVNALRYNVRNMIGDLERLIASGQQAALTKIPAATKMLILKAGEVYEDAKRLGVINSSLWHEMGDISKIKHFEQFKKLTTPKTFKSVTKAIFTAPVRLVSKIGNVEQALTQFREDVLRLAIYLKTLDKIENGEKLRHWAGELSDIEAIAKKSPERAAAQLSRETMIDYGSFTPFEDKILRNGLIPFYSFQKRNAVFWPRVMKNASLEGATGKVAAVRATANLSLWLLRVLGMYAAAWVWNNKDEDSREKENSLPFWLRGMPHVNIGDVTLWGQTALSDFYEWFDFPELASVSRRHEAGFVNMEEAALEAAKIIAKAPVNKVYQSLNPFLKAPLTIITGQTGYPDVFNPHFVAKPASAKSLERAILDIMGTDAKRFYMSAKGDYKMEDTLYAYFAGWWAKPTDADTLIEQVKRTKEYTTLKTDSKVTGRAAGQAKKGREVDWQEGQIRGEVLNVPDPITKTTGTTRKRQTRRRSARSQR